MHDRHRDIREPVPARLLADLDGGPVLDVREQQHDRARLLVDLVVLLALDVLVPGRLVLGEDRGAERRHVDLAEVPDRSADVHARVRSRSGTAIPIGARPDDRQARCCGPAIAPERHGPLVRQSCSTKNDPLQPRLPGRRESPPSRRRPAYRRRAWPTTDSKPSRLVTTSPTYAKSTPRERLRVQELPARPPFDAERGRSIRASAEGARHLRLVRTYVDAVFIRQRQDRRLRDMRVVVAERRVDLPGVADRERELGLDALDLGASAG